MATMPRQGAYAPVSSGSLLNVYAAEIERAVAGTFGDNTRTTRPLFKVERTSNLSAPNVTDTTVPWQSPVADPDDMWDAGVPKRLTTQKAGVWILLCQERWLADANGSRAGKIMLNGENVFANSLASGKLPAQNDGEGVTVQIATFASLNVGDALYVNAWQSSGSAKDLIYKGHIVSTQNYGFGGTWFAGLWLGPL